MIQITEELGGEVEKILGSDPPLHREAWLRMKGWYWDMVDFPLPPTWVTIERIMAERVELYS